MKPHSHWMSYALRLAERAAGAGEVPVGAVLVKDDTLVAEGWNQTIGLNDPTAHAEIVAIRRGAQRLNNYRLVNTRLYVTIEPCTMCAGALTHSRIRSLIYGAPEPRAGAIESALQVLSNPGLNHRIDVIGGVCKAGASALMAQFFLARRAEK